MEQALVPREYGMEVTSHMELISYGKFLNFVFWNLFDVFMKWQLVIFVGITKLKTFT